MKKHLYILFALLPFAACAPENGLVEKQELGVKTLDPVVECMAGTYGMEVLSDGEFTVTLDSESWLSFEGREGRTLTASGDARIVLSYALNRGVMRQSRITLVRGRKRVEVVFTQQGILSSDITFPNHSLSISSEGGRNTVKILSIYKDEDLKIEVDYDGESGWISDIVKENNYIHFNSLPNSLEVNRKALIRVSSISYPEIYDSMQLLQLGHSIAPQDVDFATLRALLQKEDTLRIDKPYAIEGYVIGDNLEGNGAENRNISPSIQDLTLMQRTIYVQNAEGSLGFKVIFNEASDNITVRYNKVRLYLEGAILHRLGGSENDPVRYEISSLDSKSILQLDESLSSSLPVKEKTIGELVDEDVYTYLTLKDCEIPIRKGPFVPIDLRHIYVIHSYPMVVLDRNGDNTHIMTNLSASWQRDGRGLPQGAGNISGVLVHETCDNFEWDVDKFLKARGEGRVSDYITGIGNIGKYQIRPFSRSEIAISEDPATAFSEILMEVRYFNKDYSEIVKNYASNTLYSTYPAVADPIHDTSLKGYFQCIAPSGLTTALALFRDWTHIGAMSGGVITDPAAGNGVEDYYGVKTEWTPYSTVASTALIMKSSAWYSSSDWAGLKKSFMVTVNTESLTEANLPLSIQLGVFNGLGQTVGAPRYWKVEYSTDGKECTDDTKTWKQAGSYTVPDFPVLSGRKQWQCPGPKYVSVTLPKNDASLVGRRALMIRMIPSVNKAGTLVSYDEGEITNSRETALNYVALRYNR